MKGILKSIRRFETRFDEKAAQFECRHPVLGFLAVFIGMPIFILTGVCACATAAVWPVAWLLGWV